MGIYILHGMILAGYAVATVVYFRHFWTKHPGSGIYASLFLVFALACHSAFLIARAVESSHAPFVGLHESMSFFAWLIAVVYLCSWNADSTTGRWVCSSCPWSWRPRRRPRRS